MPPKSRKKQARPVQVHRPLSAARKAKAEELEAFNRGLPPIPPEMTAAGEATHYSCDLCGREPISAWRFKPVKDPDSDLCYPCVKSGLAQRQFDDRIWFLGWCPRYLHAKSDNRETSDDEEAGIENPKSTRVGVETALMRPAARKKALKLIANAARVASEQAQASPPVENAAAATTSKSEPAAGKKKPKGKAAREVVTVAATESPLQRSPSRPVTEADAVDAAAAPAPEPQKFDTSRIMAALSQLQPTGPAESPPEETRLSSVVENVADEPELTINAPAKLSRAEGAPTHATPAKEGVPPAVDGRTPPAANPLSRPSSVIDATAGSPASAPPQSPTAADSSSRAGDSALARFFRAFDGAPQRGPALDPSDAKQPWIVDGQELRPGQARQTTTADGRTHSVAVVHGEIASVRVVPTLPSEGLWISALTRGAHNMISLWQLPPVAGAGEDALGTPRWHGTLSTGKDDCAAFEWLPVALHNDQVLGFTCVVKANFIMSGLVPRALPQSPLHASSARACGITPLPKALEGVAARWVVPASQREGRSSSKLDLTRTCLVVVTRCLTILTFGIVSQEGGRQLVLAARGRIPPPRASVQVPPGIQPPMVVGTRNNGDTFAAIAHGAVVMIVDSSGALSSVVQLASPIVGMSATGRGVYCSMQDGKTAYARLSGREHFLDELTTPRVSAVCARPSDVLLCTNEGRVKVWAPPQPLRSDLALRFSGNSVSVVSSPSEQPAADASTTTQASQPKVSFSFHPIETSPFLRFAVASAAPNLLVVLSAPISPAASTA